MVDEFEKVESIRQQSAKSMAEAEQDQESLLIAVRPDNWQTTEQFVDALGKLRRQRGHLTTIKDYRYIDLQRIEELDEQLLDVEKQLSEKTVEFLMDEQAFEPYQEKIAQLNKDIEKLRPTPVCSPL